MQNRTIAPTDYNVAIGDVESAASSAAGAGRAAADYVGDKIANAASGIQAAATTLQDNVSHSRGAEALGDLAHDATAKLSATAEYLRDSNANEMIDDLKTLLKNNPGKSLAIALLVGFVVGRNLRSNE